jgi:putative ABC transport system permease protein
MSHLLRFLSIRYWLRHRGAFFLAVLGVALGITVFVAVQVANYSVLASFAASLNAVSGKANLQIRGGANGLPEEVFVRLKQKNDPRIQAAAPLLARTLYSPTLKTTLLVLGVDLFSEIDFRAYDFRTDSGATTTGPPGRFLTDPRAIVISRQLAERHNLKPGSKLEIYSGVERKRFEVYAVLDGEAMGQAYGGDFAILDIAAAQEAFSELGRLARIDLIVDEAQLDAVARDLKAMLPADATVQRPAQRGEQVSAMLSAFQLNLTALSCIAVFVGAFLIYNAVASAVVRRRPEAGILRAVGASRSQLRQLFLTEAALIGFVGSVVGLLIGILLARFALQAVSTTVSALYIAVKARSIMVPTWLWWSAPSGGTVLAVLAAWPAAQEAATTSPRAAMQRVTLHQSTQRFAGLMAAVGAALLALAWLLCQPFLSGRTPLAGFAAAFCTLTGFALFTPLFTMWGSRLAQRVLAKLPGVEGTLAASYLQRALNRSSLVIAALMVSLSMMIGLGVMVGSFRETVGHWVSTTINADLFVAPATGFSGDPGAGLPGEVVKYVTTLPEVRMHDTVRNAETEVHGKPVVILANTIPAIKTGDRVIRFLETVEGDTAARQSFLENKAILVSERFQTLLGVHAGDTLTLDSPSGPVGFFVAGVFYDYNPNTIMYMPQPLYRKYWRDYQLDALAVYLKPGASADEVKRKLDERFGAHYQLSVLLNRDLRKDVFDTFDQTFAVTYALQLIAIIVAIIGIFDTLISLLLERSRELATLRAMGASARQIRKMIFIEFGLIGLFAWLIAVASGLCLAWELIYVINRQFFGWTIQWTLSPAVLWQALALSLLASLGAGVLPARGATRRDVATALQTE